jgi:hypothetical protein
LQALANSQPPNGTIIEYNTAEHCGYFFLQIASGTNTIVSHNTLNNCPGMAEADSTSQANTGDVADSNHLTFTHGVGCRASILPGCNGFDGLTCGISASATPYNYSGNSCSNNIVDGPHASGLYENAAGGTQDNATYINNTCTGGCVLNQYD